MSPKKFVWHRKHLLDLEDLSETEILHVLDQAASFKEISTREVKKVPTLRGKTIVHLFFESSTRTRTSFELAAKRLSADTVNLSASASSVVKGETLLDTARNIEAMNIDAIVMRHSMAGAAKFLSERLNSSIINAGDGSHEHPTQGLLDLFTIKEKKRDFKNLKVVIVGDIKHSRVARSNIWGLKKLGAEVCVVGPPTLMPIDIEHMGVKVSYNLNSAIKDADVINILRIQLERQKGGLFPSLREYRQVFGINKETLRGVPKNVLIMHPGPINRGIELDPEVADGSYSVILDQVTNGVAVRMAILYLLLIRAGKRKNKS
jgi:aspartate carbamoyltransferase catalytic subunit